MPVRPVNQITQTGAISDPNYPTQWGVPTEPTDTLIKDYAVAGDCIQVQSTVSDFNFMRADLTISDQEYNDFIKMQMCQLLVEELMKSKYIEFTSEYIHHKDTKIFRARIFATPDAQVRMLRQLKVIK
jgi:hypothetical protein